MDIVDNVFQSIEPHISNRVHQEEIILRLDKLVNLYEEKLKIDTMYRLTKEHRASGHIILNTFGVPTINQLTHIIQEQDDEPIFFIPIVGLHQDISIRIINHRPNGKFTLITYSDRCILCGSNEFIISINYKTGNIDFVH